MRDFGRVALVGRRVPQPGKLGGLALEYIFLLGMEYQFVREVLGRHLDERARGEVLVFHENESRVVALALAMGYCCERAPDVDGRVRLLLVRAPPRAD